MINDVSIEFGMFVVDERVEYVVFEVFIVADAGIKEE